MQTLIENVNIVNPFEEIESSQNVLLEDNLIKEISNSEIQLKDNVNVIDGAGQLLASCIYRLSLSYLRQRIP